MRPYERGGPVAEPPLDRLAFVGLVDRALFLEDPLGRREHRGDRTPGDSMNGRRSRSRTRRAFWKISSASRDGAGEMREVPPPRGDDIERFVESAAEREVHDADRPHQERGRDEPRERQDAVVLEHRRDRRAVLLETGTAPRLAARCPPCWCRRPGHGRAASSRRGSRRPGCASRGPGPRARRGVVPQTRPPPRVGAMIIAAEETHSTSRTRSNWPWSISPGCSEDDGRPEPLVRGPADVSQWRAVRPLSTIFARTTPRPPGRSPPGPPAAA